jgi:CubicO group peptidase (beta-lactamase class C family)
MSVRHLPESLGLDPLRWQAALDLVDGWCRRDLIPGAAVVVGRPGKTTGTHMFGRQGPAGDSPPLREDALFLVASITKPIVATAALLLVERGQIALGEQVHEYLPEFGGTGRYGITVRHLLTHTSGLPDMVPNNRSLRAARAPLPAFIDEICRLKPSFAPGRGVQYQSTGFALLAEIISRVSGKTCREFLRDELFAPLGMSETTLGAPDDWFAGPSPVAGRIAEIRAPRGEFDSADWGWNSRYWRSFGAPWGGILTTAGDLAKFADMMLCRGVVNGRSILSAALVEAATRNQLDAMPDVPEDERRCRPWGLGWRLNWPAHGDTFGDFVGPNAYGHWGATGTLMWIDPDREAFVVIHTTEPKDQSGRLLVRLSNAIAAALR